MSKWYIKNNFMINLDACGRIEIEQKFDGYDIIFFNLDLKYVGYNTISFTTENEANDCFNEIKTLLSKKDKYSILSNEINELREMIKYLPVVGSVYVEAKEEFEANSKINF
jgi:hypothetical protein